MRASDIQHAERVARQRAILFYLMAAVLVLSVVTAMNNTGSRQILRVAIWLFMVALTAANLTPFVGWLRPPQVNELLNDDTTRDHRRTSFAAGFWAALASAMAVAVVGSIVFIASVDGMRIVITAALSAALIAFATQEIRATR